MEGNSDVVRVKEEPINFWTDATVDNVFVSLDYCKVENSETVPFHDLPAKSPDQDVADTSSSTTRANVRVPCNEKLRITHHCVRRNRPPK
uniref:Uncharacterized protein n=1 Tax=Trichogramma kaykai TaxID=54128 RepID=A0ABD2W1N3_9HYME